MRHCLTLLRRDGLLLVQTPRLSPGTTYEDLVARQDRFLELLQPAEHLYLFSESSVRELFHRLGADFLEFEPAIFSRFDMFLAVSAAPLSHSPPSAIEAVLRTTPGGRMVQALLDLGDQFQDLQQRYFTSEADRAARLQVSNEQGQQLIAADAARTSEAGRLRKPGQHVDDERDALQEHAAESARHSRHLRRCWIIGQHN